MNKTRLPILIIVVSLSLSAFIALQALANSGSDANRGSTDAAVWSLVRSPEWRRPD